MMIELLHGDAGTGLERLNPYSNGMMIEQDSSKIEQQQACLNPYSNGMMIELMSERFISCKATLS